MSYVSTSSKSMMRKLFVICSVVLFAAFGLVSVLPGQTIEEGGQPATDSAPEGEVEFTPAPDGGFSANDYNPLALVDARFRVANFNLDRRYAGNGHGEFLDVVFDVNNLTSENVRLYAYVVAFYESDAVNERERQWVPYPRWRDRDYPAEQFLVHQITVTPQDIPTASVWNPSDSDYHDYVTTILRMRGGVAGNVPVQDIKPPFWKYVEYINAHPTQGLEFTLYGEKGPTPDKILQSNFPRPTPEEQKSRVHKNLFRHKYTLQHNRRVTIFRSHHFSRFRADYKFFNRVAIMLFDADKADAMEAQAAEGVGEGDEPISPLIFKKVFQFNKPLKNS
ncbi:MAG: hypothetical protein RIF32_15100 [Leptospirales bacterium]|jgi:hypothetical protein